MKNLIEPCISPDLTNALIAATKRLAEAVEFDVNGCLGQGGNGGLTSDEALRAASAAKLVLSRTETSSK